MFLRCEHGTRLLSNRRECLSRDPLSYDHARGGQGRRRAVPSGPAPRTADGKPDLSGVWSTDRPFVVDITGALKKGETLPMKPGIEMRMKEHLSKDDPEAQCLPTGVPRLAPYPMKYLQMPKLFVILFEGNIHSYRQVFLDRTKHPKDLNPSWYGDSIGHWEGDTLVIDTVGFNDKFWFDFAGHPHTEQLHTIERYTRTDRGTLLEEVTIDDPGAYNKPFTLVGRNRLDEKAEVMEYICQENNQDPTHIVGPASPVQ
jgi:hypothetical protein